MSANLLEIFLVTAYTLFFVFVIGRAKFFQIPGLDQRLLKLAFIIKVLAGISLGLIYTYYYKDRTTADIFKYFDDSAIMFAALQTAPLDFFQMLTGLYGKGDHLWNYFDEMNNWFNSRYYFCDSRTMIRLNAFFRFFSLGFYYVHSVFICFLSFIGLTALLKMAVSVLPDKPVTNYLMIFAFPSLIFWGSGVLKESLLLFALGTLLFVIDRTIQNLNAKGLIASVLLLFLLLNIKPYILALILPALMAYIWTKSSGGKILSKYASTHVIYLGIVLVFTSLLLGTSFPKLISDKQEEFQRVAEVQEAKSVIVLPILDGSYSTLIKASPKGLFTTLFRPHLLEAKNPLILMSAMENILILLLLLIGVYLLLKRGKIKWSPLLLLSVFFILILFTLIGLVTPILGAIVRYKVPALPFLGIIFAHFVNMDRFLSRKFSGDQ